MVSDETLNEFRMKGTILRIVRDAEPANDVRGTVVAWDDEYVIIRKRNRRVVKLSRKYIFQPFEMERVNPFES